MHHAFRPYLTTGVALLSAGVIVVNPVTPPPPDIRLAAPAVSSANVQLAADFATLFANTAANLQALLEQANFDFVDPTTGDPNTTLIPILNQIGQNTGDSIAAIIDELGGGNPIALLGAVLDAINQPIQNFALVADGLLSPATVVLLAAALVTPLLSTVFATGEAIENVLDPDTPEDFVPALINFVPTVLDGLLNGGYGSLTETEIPNLLPPQPRPPLAIITTRPGGLLNQLETISNPGVPTSFTDITLPGLASTLLSARDGIAVTLGAQPAQEPTLTLTTFTGGEEEQLNNLDTQGTADTVKERKGPVKRILESFKAIPGGKAGSVGENSARPRPIKAAVEGFTSTLKSVREGVRDSLGLSPKDTKDDAPE